MYHERPIDETIVKTTVCSKNMKKIILFLNMFNV